MSAQRREPRSGSPASALRTLLLVLAALLPVLGLLVAAPAADAHHVTGKVTFCHATASSTHPYVVVTTDPASIIRRGHDHHTGPVWSPTLAAHTSWGDVIPAFTWADAHGTSHRYAGLNTDRLDVVAGAQREVDHAALDALDFDVDGDAHAEQRRAAVRHADPGADRVLALVAVLLEQRAAGDLEVAHQLRRRVDAQLLAEEVDGAATIDGDLGGGTGACGRCGFHGGPRNISWRYGSSGPSWTAPPPQ